MSSQAQRNVSLVSEMGSKANTFWQTSIGKPSETDQYHLLDDEIPLLVFDEVANFTQAYANPLDVVKQNLWVADVKQVVYSSNLQANQEKS